MGRITPIAVSDKTAAGMLDMPVSKFLRLVNVGACPPPTKIGDEVRWRVSDLEAILSGDAARPESEDME